MQLKNKYVVIIAYEFPPLQKGGVFRPLGFVNGLFGSGIIPIIITRSEESMKISEVQCDFDFDLLNKINPEAIIIKVSSLIDISKTSKIVNDLRIILYPNGIEGKYWRKNILKIFPEIYTKYKPEFLLVTAPPFSVIDISRILSKKYKLKYFIDLRDAWSNWFTAPYFSYFHFWYKRYKERLNLVVADKIIVTSKQTIIDLKSVNNISNEKFIYIPNGYDGVLDEWIPNCLIDKVINIGYVGSFYFDPVSRNEMLKNWKQKKGHKKLQYVPNLQDWEYRSPKYFFAALQQLFEIEPKMKSLVKVHFVGDKPNWIVEMIDEFSLKENVFFYGRISREEAVAFQKNMDMLLLTSSKMINGRDYSIAGKTFEYFKVQKPILSFACDGAQKDLLIESGIALVCDPDNSSASADQMLKFIKGEIMLSPNLEFLESLSRTRQTSILVQNFLKCAES